MTNRGTKGNAAPRWLGVSAAILLSAIGASTATAETLLMPARDYLAGSPEVVWGITTQANGTEFVIDYGDGSQQSGNVADRSYIAFQHTYALANTYNVQLCVGPGAAIPACPGEVATVQVRVFNGGALSAENLRNLNINRSIHNGLRYLWAFQSNRVTFDTTNDTSWGGGHDLPYTSLVVLALQNHGFTLPNNNNAPTGIFPKYAVRRGFNAILERLETVVLGLTPAGDDPCVSVPAPVCDGLVGDPFSGEEGYVNALVILPFAASNALLRQSTEALNPDVANKTFGEILQRLVNATIWGQGDDENASGLLGRGGWWYTFNTVFASDGSAVGWNLLALLDAEAAGATIPAWVRSEWAFALANGLNNDGTYDYQTDGNRDGRDAVNIAKTGVGIQGMFFAGRPANDPDLLNALQFISDNWTGFGGGQSFICPNGTYNKGCGYGMYNVFKGLRLYGISTVSGVGRPAGPGAIPVNDWYADYEDWLVANQNNPTGLIGGHWFGGGGANSLVFSSIDDNIDAAAALALLILAPTALIAPDPELFGTVGLKHGSPLTTDPDSNPVNTPHTVVAKAQSSGGTPIPGVTISFQITGRNGAIVPASGITDANGEVSRTYTDAGPAGSGGVDQIRAFIGQVGSNIGSNILVKNWVAPQALVCDTDNDGDVDSTDVQNIRNRNGQAAGPNDPHDPNNDGRINLVDVRFCQLRIPR